MSVVRHRGPDTIARLGQAIRRAARDEIAYSGTSVERWRVVQQSPLLIEQIEGDLTLEDGDPDFVVGDNLRRHIVRFGLAADDLVVVARMGGEWHALDAATGASLEEPEGGGAGSYVHTQGTPAATWTVVHRLGVFPNVQTFSSARDQIEGVVAHANTNELTITFNAATSGVAYLN